MASILRCNSCGAPVLIPDHLIGSGQRLACPHCHVVLAGGGPSAAPPPVSARSPDPPPLPRTSEPQRAAKPRPVRKPSPSPVAPPLVKTASVGTPRRKAPPVKPRIDDDLEESGGAYEVINEPGVTPQHIPSLEEERLLEEVRSGLKQQGSARPPGTAASWLKVRTGLTLLLWGFYLAVGMIGLMILVVLVLRAFLSFGEEPPVGRGFLSFFFGLQTLVAVACEILTVVGLVLCMASPSKYGARTLAVCALILFLVSQLFLVGMVVSIGRLVAGSMAPSAHGTTDPLAAGLAVLLGGALGLLTPFLLLAANVAFLLFLRAVALCLRADGLARSIFALLIFLAVAGALSLVLSAVSHGMTAATMTGDRAQPADSFFSLALVNGCLSALLGLIVVIWEGMVLYQARVVVDDCFGGS
jgi:hypothetical protein